MMMLMCPWTSAVIQDVFQVGIDAVGVPGVDTASHCVGSVETGPEVQYYVFIGRVSVIPWGRRSAQRV